MDQLEVSSAADLADRLGWKRGTERLVQKWLSGENQPGFSYTIEMLEAAGFVSLNGTGPVALSQPRDRLAELEATVEAQGRATTTALKALAEGIGRLEQRLPAEAPPASRRKAAR